MISRLIRQRFLFLVSRLPSLIDEWRLTGATQAKSRLGKPFNSAFSAGVSAVSELVLLLSADSDIQAAFEYYETFQVGRGEVLLRHLDAAFGQLRALPEIAPLFHKSYRRLLVHGFPYGIFYTIEGRRIIISGVMDLRQDPSIIRKRLRSS